MQRLMVVESPNKIKKLEAILGAEWKVMASYGHVRDLPPKDLGIDLDDFGLTYEYLPPVKRGDKTFPGSAERVAAIKKQAKGADRVYLAPAEFRVWWCG
ncbi:toprim domain-containing protein [Stenotrophomonas maltophilia]|uniref:toprim domain-containing protein n=1 Tax=Stenotrophomonas maltophilia TaxID=40324 RepID=UPI002E76862C|nr:toprim domain-containing protein [Stenotrophomonas maltophilia]